MGRFPAGKGDLSFLQRVETGSRTQPTSYDRGTEGKAVEAWNWSFTYNLVPRSRMCEAIHPPPPPLSLHGVHRDSINSVTMHYKHVVIPYGEPIIYTGCPRRNVPDFGRVFLMLNYTDITQNTYIQSWTVTEIMAREKCGLLAGPCTVPVSWQFYQCPSLSAVSYYFESAS
jgi:hypothetical protein